MRTYILGLNFVYFFGGGVDFFWLVYLIIIVLCKSVSCERFPCF